MKLTIGIKALNEQDHIVRALTSALATAARLGGEVILADSGSTDKTIEIARQYPVRIYQLADPNERSCGAGAQLAFQYARGAYFYMLDADMILDPEFVLAALEYLERYPDLAAVGGLVREMNVRNEEFQIRSRAIRKDLQAGIVDRLDGGGLYRTAAIRDAGYFADRNLHSFEEFDLAARLQCRGWKLARIHLSAVDHYGHTIGGYRLLWRRLRFGYAAGVGEVVRGAIGRPHLGFVLRALTHVRNSIAVVAWWVLLAMSLTVGSFSIAITLIIAPLLWLVWRRRSLQLAAFSLAAWNVSGFGLLVGVLQRRTPPQQWIQAVEFSQTSAVLQNAGCGPAER